MSIASVSIRNFRSILTMNEKAKDLNIFVGQNDEGKSNILRALDLFFNHNRDNGYRFDWTHDYCSFAVKKQGKAEEIEIKLEISPPSTFSKRTPVLWKKIWRREGLYRETMVHTDRTDVSATSKIAAFLKAMRFDYVPAIKGQEYFQRLMTCLHDMLEATVEADIRQASGSFTSTINSSTRTILGEIQRLLGLETTIQLPTNLRDLFSQLEFTSVSEGKSFSLNQRGDGIKVRHIPIVLRWLAEQANHLSAPGRPRTVTVWGYEEPENNLELRRCFDLAKEFVDGASSIQAFVTTHSPAFYSVFRTSDHTKVGLFLVTKGTTPPISIVRPISDLDMAPLDSSMGLMDLLEPHFRQARQEIEMLRSTVTTLKDLTLPVLLLEGPTDVQLITTAWNKLNPTIPMPFSPIGCGAGAGAGGAKTLNSAVRFLNSVFKTKVVAVFDNDREGAPQFSGLKPPDFIPGIDQNHRRHRTKDVHAILLPTPTGREPFVPTTAVHRVLEIEHYFSDAILAAHGMKGGPIYDGSNVFEIEGDKTAFASIATTLPDTEFGNFSTLFSRLQSLIQLP